MGILEENGHESPAAQGPALAAGRILRFLTAIGDQLPLLVDDLDDSMMTAFDAYPFRLYALTPDGRVAVESQKGASGFAPSLARIERWLGERSFASRGFSRE